MPISTITYSDKSDINVNSNVPSTNKVQATDMNEIKSVVNNNADVTNGLKGTILWTNSSPTSVFGPQNITLSSSDYDFLEIYYYDWIDTKRMMSQKVIKGKNALINALFYANTNFFMSNRPLTYNSDTSYSVGDCVALYGSSTFLVDQAINYVCVPLYVIGYKTELF